MRGFGIANKRRGYMDTARRRGLSCPHKAFLDAEQIEAQIGRILASAVLPDDWRNLALAQVGAQRADISHAEAERAKLRRRLERTKQLFQMGDMDTAAYKAERERIQRQLSSLPSFERIERDLTKAAAMLRDFGALWGKATLAQRERGLRLILRRVLIENGSIKAIEPLPDFYPLLKHCDIAQSASDGDGSRARQKTIVILPPGTIRRMR